MSLSRSHLTLICSVVVIAISFFLIYYGLGKNTTIDHFDHTLKEKDSVKLSRVEHNENLLKDGDALEKNNFKINSQFVDPDNNCDFCTQVNYTIGKAQFAAVAYRTEKIDLTGSERVVFFARGQNGGETISFLAAGKSEAPTFGANSNQSFIFPGISFTAIAHNITLSKDWKRYEISLYDADLRNITYPFGFAIERKSSGSLAFYLKGVTFDDKFALNPNLGQ